MRAKNFKGTRILGHGGTRKILGHEGTRARNNFLRARDFYLKARGHVKIFRARGHEGTSFLIQGTRFLFQGTTVR